MKCYKSPIIWLFGTVILLYLNSCATAGRYQDKNQEVFSQLEFSNFEAASLSLDALSFFQKDRNKLLYFMEKGKLEHMVGNFSRSNSYFEQAYILLDDGIKNSVGTTILSNLSNPMMENYKGEDFEKVLIHYYKALNYFQLGKADTALIEAKRINIKLNEINDKYDDNKNKYQYDAFAQILQGVIYESIHEINDAFIAYRNAEKIYEDHNNLYMNVAMPLQLKKDLLRTSKVLGFSQEHKDYLKKYPNVPVETLKNSAIVFWENGLGPKKSQMMLSANGALGTFVGTYSDDQTQIVIPIPVGTSIGINAIAFPEYLKGTPAYNKASLTINGKEQFFEVSEDITAIAKQCLKDRSMREVVKTAIRFASKKGVSTGFKALASHFGGSLAGDVVGMGVDAAGAAMEKADTRNWQSLPATISYTRVALPEKGEQKIPMTKYGEQRIVDTIVLKASDRMQIISLFDINNSAMGGSNVVQGNTAIANVSPTNQAETAASIMNSGNRIGTSADKKTTQAVLEGGQSNQPRTFYKSGGLDISYGLSNVNTDAMETIDYGYESFQLNYVNLKNHLSSKFAHGFTLGIDFYQSDDELSYEPLAIGDLTLGYSLKKYFKVRNERLVGFNLYTTPTLGINFLELDETSTISEYVKFKNSFDVNLKFGFGYDLGIGKTKQNRLSLGTIFSYGLLNRNTSEYKDDYNYNTVFIGFKLGFDFGF